MDTNTEHNRRPGVGGFLVWLAIVIAALIAVLLLAQLFITKSTSIGLVGNAYAETCANGQPNCGGGSGGGESGGEWYGTPPPPSGTPTLEASAPTATASGMSEHCYSSHWAMIKWKLAGNDVAWIKIQQNGYCGIPGCCITRDFGWSASNWAWGVYCVTNFSKSVVWNPYPNSKQGTTRGTEGYISPFGCIGMSGAAINLRVWANGYWTAWAG